MPPTKAIDLNIEVDVLTSGSVADLVNSILEFLLYQRNQIPFVYKTYKFLCGKWTEEEEQITDTMVTTVNAIQLQQQREQAVKTREAISAMRQLIFNSFENHVIRCLRFLFGATAFTPKEAYTIHIPINTISKKHCNDHHRIPHSRLNQTLLSLLTSEDLYGIFSNNLNPTNLYLELELLEDAKTFANNVNNKKQIFPKDISLLPASCKDIHLHLLHTRPLNYQASALQCCKELQIFEDLIGLKLDSEEQHKITRKDSIGFERDDEGSWWETDIIVRGFKEKPIKGCSMWHK